MIGATGSNPLNPLYTPPTSPLEDLRRGDPAALIPCLKEHQVDYVPLYLALLNKSGLKSDVQACERFAEALFYASLRLLPEIVEKLLAFPMTLPCSLNPANPLPVFNANLATTYITIEDKIEVNQFGFEEAIYAAIIEGHAQVKLYEAERIVKLMLDKIVRMYESIDENDRRDYCLNNSGKGGCNASYLDKSLEFAQSRDLRGIVAVLKPYVDNYGISPDEDITDRLDRLVDNLVDREQLCNLSADLAASLREKRYRYLDREVHTKILFFAITHQLTDLVKALLAHPQFDLGEMEYGEIVDLFSHAVIHLNVPVINYLSENLEDFEDIILGHQNNEAQSPIVTCLQSYLEQRRLPYCPNPRAILRILFELDCNMNDQLEDAEAIEIKIRVLKEEMADRQYSFDKPVMDVVNEYLIFDSDQSDIEDRDDIDSAGAQAGDSDNE